MTKLVSDEYKQTLRDTHKAHEGRWGATACRRIFDLLPYIMRDGEPSTLLDYGSADGKFQLQARRRNMLPNTEIIEYDPGYEDIENNNIPCEFVLCVDVLEHIEPDYLDAVLQDLQRCTTSVGLFDIAMFPSRTVLADGRDAHLIVEDERWWAEKLQQYFNILDEAVFQLGPGYPVYRVYVEAKKED